VPLLNLRLVAPVDPAQAQQATALLTGLTATILRKKRELTAITVEPVGRDLWSIGGSAVSEPELATFALDIKVTQGTNTDREKAAYVQAVFEAMEDLLGPLHAASYVIVDEVPAAAWGYGGRTQADRFAAQASA
jgi:4-oxalocrotonate tautomerase